LGTFGFPSTSIEATHKPQGPQAERSANPISLRFPSKRDVFTPQRRAKIGTIQDVPPRTSPTNVIRVSVKEKRMDFFRQQVPWELPQGACELLLEAHNRQERILIAKDFERHALGGK
jgi:hypothetical protein